MNGNEVWVWAEQRGGKLMSVSIELLGKGAELAQDLGTSLAGVLLGDKVDGLAQELIACGADKVYLVEDPRIELYQSDVYANILADLVTRRGPEIVLLGATTVGMDLAPRVAAKVGTGLTAHCVDLDIDQVDGKPQLAQLVPGFGGNIMVKIVCPEKRPQMATVRPGVMEKPGADSSRQGEIIRVEASIKDEDLRAKTVEIVEEKPAGVPPEEADIVVAGGWGMNAAGGFKMVNDMAKLLGGAVAGTRPAVDKGWVSHDRMIGQSGKTVSPKLFISLGASGAMHFTSGFMRAKVVLAVDQNPDAPIFNACDIGIVGDVGEVIPALMEEIKKG